MARAARPSLLRLAAALSAAAAASAATTLQLRLLPKAQYPAALCNDGTQAAYYFRPSPKGSLTWVVHQEGGGSLLQRRGRKKPRATSRDAMLQRRARRGVTNDVAEARTARRH
jgi:hypothetical protein